VFEILEDYPINHLMEEEIKEQIIFPEINVEKVTKVLGMDVTFVTTAKTDREAFELLSSFGMPFIKKEIKTV